MFDRRSRFLASIEGVGELLRCHVSGREWHEAAGVSQCCGCYGGGMALSARAQQPKMPVIGILYQGGQGSLVPPQIAAFRDGLRDAGYIEGQNIELQYRASERP